MPSCSNVTTFSLASPIAKRALSESLSKCLSGFKVNLIKSHATVKVGTANKHTINEQERIEIVGTLILFHFKTLLTCLLSFFNSCFLSFPFNFLNFSFVSLYFNSSSLVNFNLPKTQT